MTIVSNFSTFGTASRLPSIAVSCVAMTVPPSSNDLVRTVRRKEGAHIARIYQLATRGAWSFLTTQGSHEIVLERKSAGSGPRRHVELGEDVLHVPRNRVLAYDERHRDLSIALPAGNEPKHLQLTGRQSMQDAASGVGVQRDEIGRCPQRFEGASSRRDLQRVGIAVAELLAG